jgi:hypothetical protein
MAVVVSSQLLGAFLLRNSQHADEFAQCATIIAKDFLFETKDYQIAGGFTLLSYFYYLRMDKEKAIVLNNLASSICKNLNVLVCFLFLNGYNCVVSEKERN